MIFFIIKIHANHIYYYIIIKENNNNKVNRVIALAFTFCFLIIWYLK